MATRVIFYGGGPRGGKTREQLLALVAKARAAHEAGRFKERDRACSEHDRIVLRTYGGDE